jgi:hypothetical protein
MTCHWTREAARRTAILSVVPFSPFSPFFIGADVPKNGPMPGFPGES